MKLLEALSPFLNESQQIELQQLFFDCQNLNPCDFYKKHKKFVDKHWDKEDFIEHYQYHENTLPNLQQILSVQYLTEIKFAMSIDWSGEEYQGQIKKFLHSRLKHYGYSDIKLNDSAIKNKLKNNEVKRGEWIPLLLNCFDKQVAFANLKIANLSLGDDEYNIALVPYDWFVKMNKAVIDGYLEVTDTSIWELKILEIGENKAKAMILLKSRFNVALSEIKDFISVLPIDLGRGSEKQLLKLKHEYEQAGCKMQLDKCDE